MTVKIRFTQKDKDDWEIFEDGTHLAYAHSGYNAQKLIERLNELNNENNKLKKDNAHLKVLLHSLQDTYGGLLKLVHGFDGDME